MLDIFFQRKGAAFEQAKSDGEFHWKAAVVRRGTLDNRTDRDEGWSVEGRIPWDDFARTGGRPADGRHLAICPLPLRLHAQRKAGDLDLRSAFAAELSLAGRLRAAQVRRHEDGAERRGRPEGPTYGGIPTQAFVKTSNVVGSPDPPLPYRPVRAFPNLKLTFPIALDRIPGSDQLLIIVQDKTYGPVVDPASHGRSECRAARALARRFQAAARPTASAFIPNLPTTAISTSAGTALVDGEAEADVCHAVHDGPPDVRRSIPNRHCTSSRGSRTAITAAILDSASTACFTSRPATARVIPIRISAAKT